MKTEIQIKQSFKKPEVIAGLQIIMYILLIFTTIFVGLNKVTKEVASGILVIIWIFFLISECIRLNDILARIQKEEQQQNMNNNNNELNK